MAQYKVPQDVEADDKLLGPFTFRQFVYLLIAGGLVALAVALFQLFPLLAIIPVPFILFLAILALPLKKDQPMEAYVAAIVSYYLKPRTKQWVPGQRESTIMVTAPKKADDDSVRKRNISGEEVTHRLSFLADIVDTEGYAIKGVGPQRMSNELVAEANMANDMFETNHFEALEDTIARDENANHERIMQEMREAIETNERGRVDDGVRSESRMDERDTMIGYGVQEERSADEVPEEKREEQIYSVEELMPTRSEEVENVKNVDNTGNVRDTENAGQIAAKPSIIELANNPDYTIATISKEANRIKERDEGEVFVSLH